MFDQPGNYINNKGVDVKKFVATVPIFTYHVYRQISFIL